MDYHGNIIKKKATAKNIDDDESHEKKHVPGLNVNLRLVRGDANDQLRILVVARNDLAQMEELV